MGYVSLLPNLYCLMQGDYPVYNGQIAKFVTKQSHSIAVYDARNVQQFYFLKNVGPPLYAHR